MKKVLSILLLMGFTLAANAQYSNTVKQMNQIEYQASYSSTIRLKKLLDAIINNADSAVSEFVVSDLDSIINNYFDSADVVRLSDLDSLIQNYLDSAGVGSQTLQELIEFSDVGGLAEYAGGTQYSYYFNNGTYEGILGIYENLNEFTVYGPTYSSYMWVVDDYVEIVSDGPGGRRATVWGEDGIWFQGPLDFSSYPDSVFLLQTNAGGAIGVPWADVVNSDTSSGGGGSDFFMNNWYEFETTDSVTQTLDIEVCGPIGANDTTNPWFYIKAGLFTTADSNLYRIWEKNLNVINIGNDIQVGTNRQFAPGYLGANESMNGGFATWRAPGTSFEIVGSPLDGHIRLQYKGMHNTNLAWQVIVIPGTPYP